MFMIQRESSFQKKFPKMELIPWTLVVANLASRCKLSQSLQTYLQTWPQRFGSSVQHRRMSQIPLRRIINKKAGSVLQYGNDLFAHFFRDRRATKRCSHDTIFTKDPLADIRSPMDHDVSPVGHIIKASFYSIDAKRKPIASKVSAPGHIEAQAALIRLGSVGK